MTRRVLVATNSTRGTQLAGRLEEASSFVARLFGLMGRSPLAADEGLWLPDSNGIHMLFMRFAIDAVFVSGPDHERRRRVLSTNRRLKPWLGVVWWVRGAKGVLELPAGTIDATGTQVGDTLELASGEMPG